MLEAEQGILAALRGAKGRGRTGLDATAQLELEAAVELLERDGGVAGESAPRTLLHVCGCCCCVFVPRIDPQALPYFDAVFLFALRGCL